MIFDISKIISIEKEIAELFYSIPQNNRTIRIEYSSCFSSLFRFKRVQNFFSKKYNILSLDNVTKAKQPQNKPKLWLTILGKTVSTLLGFIPIIGSYISIVVLLSEISVDIIHDKSINDIEKQLTNKWKKKKRYKRIKNIIYIGNLSSLTQNELKQLSIISFLINEKYVDNTMLIIAQSLECSTPYLFGIKTIKKYTAKSLLYPHLDANRLEIKNALTIINIVGVEFAEIINSAINKSHPYDKTVEVIIDSIWKDKNIIVTDEFEQFLNSCSILFEEFELKDIEYVADIQNNKNYQELFSLARQSQIIQDINLQKFYFLQPFIREYYQQIKNSLSSSVYKSIFCYLETNYHWCYDDLAIASSVLVLDTNTILTKHILAYYYAGNTMPLYKLNRITETLMQYPLGEHICQIDYLYNENKANAVEAKDLCEKAYLETKISHISDEAKLAVLSFVTRLYYELDFSQEELIKICDYYRYLLAKIGVLSKNNIKSIEYALDYIVFSTSIEDDYKTHHTAQGLVALILKTDTSLLPINKLLKLLRLGNVIFPENISKAEELLHKGYLLSEPYPYINGLFRINYSSVLVLGGDCDRARNILKPLIKEGTNNRVLQMSAINNYIVASCLIDKKLCYKGTIQLSAYCKMGYQSDFCICINNYVSLSILCGIKSLNQSIMICKELLANTNDPYHIFFAKQNLIVLFFLNNDSEFWECIDTLQVPYLLINYKTILSDKISFLKANYYQEWSVIQLSYEMKNYLIDKGHKNISSYYTLPVLLGLIERWFE